MNRKTNILSKEEQKIKKTRMLIYKIVMILFDISAIFLLIWELKNKSVNISSYIVLFMCNFIVFFVKPDL